MRRALLVGINHYSWTPLQGCINDVNNMEKALSMHYDQAPNFHCKKLMSSQKKRVTRHKLMEHVKDLFSREADMALLYFSGHGMHNELGGVLVTQDAVQHDEGVTVSDIITLANKADNIRQIFIILDCCHSGNAGSAPILNDNVAILRKGVSILTASLHDQYAVEKRMTKEGLFTKILIEGLKGGAADIVGDITAAALYNYVEKILGPWDQRPVFKTHSATLTAIRHNEPRIDIETLKEIVNYFPQANYQYPLDPSYDPELEPKNPKNEHIMSHFRLFLAEGLLKPIGEKHLYHAAKYSESCQLTPLGVFYWQILNKNKA